MVVRMNSRISKRLANLRKVANAQYAAGNTGAHLITMGEIRAITTAAADKFSDRPASIQDRRFPS